MTWRKDLKSKAKKGRYFPVRFGDVVRLLKDLNLNQYDGSRLAIRMKNIEGEYQLGKPLLDIQPEEDITIYSLAKDGNERLVRKAVIKSLKILSELQERKNNLNNSRYSYYCAYLVNKDRVRLTRADISTQKSKYRGGAKFSNAFNPSKITKKEKEIKTLAF